MSDLFSNELSSKSSSKKKEDPFENFGSFDQFGKQNKITKSWTGFKQPFEKPKNFECFDFNSSIYSFLGLDKLFYK